MPDFWTLAGLGLALLAIGPSMTSVPGPGHWEFRISRICFVGAALLFFAKLAFWGAEDLSPFRLAIVAVLGAAIALGLAYSIQWVNRKQHPEAKENEKLASLAAPVFKFEKNAFVETKLVRWADGSNSGLFETRFYLLIGNAMNTGRQIKNAKARIFFMGQEPRLARIKENGELSTDIRHGEWAFFEVGKMVSRNAFPTGGFVTYGKEERKRYEPVRPEHPKHLEVLLPTGQPAYGIFQNPDQPATDWNMSMVITADDMVSLQLKVSLDLVSKTPVTFQETK